MLLSTQPDPNMFKRKKKANYTRNQGKQSHRTINEETKCKNRLLALFMKNL